MSKLIGNVFFILILCIQNQAETKTYMKRCRDQGMFHSQSANTVGHGNIWTSLRTLGFIWDDKLDSLTETSVPALHGFIEARADIGMFNFSSILFESRLISYPWDGKLQFGNIQSGLKVTYPDNKDIRPIGVGAEVRYAHSFLKNFNSIAGYRQDGTGFSPEGLIYEGGSLQAKLLCDFDLIAQNSSFPFQIMVNGGVKIPFDKNNRDLSQYLFSLGVSYSGLEFDGFIEYSLEALVGSLFSPRIVAKKWWPTEKRWEIAFTENPMYVTFGGRYHTANGLTTTLCIPLLLSSNYATAMTKEDKTNINRKPGLAGDGVRDTFDPWYAKWKIIITISYPIRYNHTGAEMRRNFLLRKNKKRDGKIDIDQRLQQSIKDAHIDETEHEDDRDAEQRLEEIQKRREILNQTE